MRIWTALLLATALALLITASSAAIRDVSWADSQHGWMAGCGNDNACVLSTENGGRTWHRIGSFEVIGLVRTSARAGVVTEYGHPAGPTWWTRDNGRHWFEADGLFRGEYVGSGRFLFSQTRRAIFQVKPWPPRRRASRRCRSYCMWNGGSHAVAVARLGSGRFAAIANLPGGVLGVVDSLDAAKPARALVRRFGRNRFSDLPLVEETRPCFSYGDEPVVTWPKIVVFGCRGAGAERALSWISEDGGRTWRVYRA